MKKTKIKGKLSLTKEIVAKLNKAKLNPAQLNNVKGGRIPTPGDYTDTFTGLC